MKNPPYMVSLFIHKFMRYAARKNLSGVVSVQRYFQGLKKKLRKGYLRRKAKRPTTTLCTPETPHRILICMNAGIGNAVETTPLIQACKMLWPYAQICIWGPRGDLFDNWCLVEKWFFTETDVKEAAPYFRIYFATVSKDLDVRRFRQYGPVEKRELRISSIHVKPEAEYYMDLVRWEGYKGPTPSLYVSIKDPDIGSLPGHPRIAILPGGKGDRGWRHKHWPHFAELTRLLLSAFESAQIYIIRTRGDYIEESMLKSKRVTDYCSKLSLQECAWVLKQVDFVIGNDCGPMHIADAVQTPGIVIFGPTCEVKNGPHNRIKAIVHNVKCRPCQFSPLMHQCKDPVCMESISPERVLSETRKMLR